MIAYFHYFSEPIQIDVLKSPKIYIRDSGIAHALLSVATHNDLLGHPVYGASWEGFVLENIINALPGWHPYFYRSVAGAEIDLVLERGQQRLAIKIKASTSPFREPIVDYFLGHGFGQGAKMGASLSLQMQAICSKRKLFFIYPILYLTNR